MRKRVWAARGVAVSTNKKVLRQIADHLRWADVVRPDTFNGATAKHRLAGGEGSPREVPPCSPDRPAPPFTEEKP
jgi:hypothetical protein